MSWIDWLLCALILGYCVFVLFRRKKKRGCCGDCTACQECCCDIQKKKP